MGYINMGSDDLPCASSCILPLSGDASSLKDLIAGSQTSVQAAGRRLTSPFCRLSLFDTLDHENSAVANGALIAVTTKAMRAPKGVMSSELRDKDQDL